MARELDIEISQRPVDPERIRTYDLPDASGVRGDPPVQAFEFSGVRATTPLEGMSWWNEMEVEIEYRPERGGRVLDLQSLHRYLSTFTEARVTEEAMAQSIRAHLIDALGVDDVFVQVKRTNGGTKRIRLGKPQ